MTVKETLNGPDANSMLSHPIGPFPSQKIEEPLSVTEKRANKPFALELISTGLDNFATPSSLDTPEHFLTELLSDINLPLLLSKAPVKDAPDTETVNAASQAIPGSKVFILSVNVAAAPDVVLAGDPVDVTVDVE